MRAEDVGAPIEAGLDGPGGEATALRRLRRTRWALWIALGIAIPLGLLAVVMAKTPPAGTRAADSPLLGKPAPAAAGQTIDRGHVRLADERGRWVLVNFFATWCVPCIREHPDLVRFAEAHRVRGDASVFGIVYSDSADAVRKFRTARGGDWPMLVDPDGGVALDFGVSGVPESFLVTPDGVIAARFLGGVTLDRLERLLAEAKARTHLN